MCIVLHAKLHILLINLTISIRILRHVDIAKNIYIYIYCVYMNVKLIKIMIQRRYYYLH